MKKAVRSVLTFVLALTLMVTSLGATAFAASSESTTLGGYTVSASIYAPNGKSSATATTSISGATSGYVSATAYVYYWFGEYHYYSKAFKDSTYCNTTAVATKELGGAEVEGGKGEHLASISYSTWTGFTTTGKNPTNATEK